MVFEFKEVGEFNGEDRICSKQICPYGLNVCNNLPDPRHGLKDDNYGFSDFCADIEIAKGLGLNLVPVPGSLEKYYGKLIEKIKLKK